MKSVCSALQYLPLSSVGDDNELCHYAKHKANTSICYAGHYILPNYPAAVLYVCLMSMYRITNNSQRSVANTWAKADL